MTYEVGTHVVYGTHIWRVVQLIGAGGDVITITVENERGEVLDMNINTHERRYSVYKNRQLLATSYGVPEVVTS